MPPALQSLLERFGGLRKVLIGLVGLAAAGVILLVSRWATAPEWVAAFPNLPLNAVSDVTDLLTKEGIGFKLGAGGTDVLVTSTDLPRARVVLAKAGTMPGATGKAPLGWNLFDGQNFGETDFGQKVKYRRALEGELMRTIGQMNGISQATVLLALNENSTFRNPNQKPSTASVTLYLKNGRVPSVEVVQGLQHLVAASVGGIDAERVAILSSDGRLLSQADDGSIVGQSSRQLGLRKEQEDHLKAKAQELLDKMLGVGNSSVEVTADLNFDKVARSSMTPDPDKQAVNTEQIAEITPGTDGGAGSSNKATSFTTATVNETVEAAVGGIKRLSVAVLVNNRLPVPVPIVPVTDTTKKKTPAEDSAAAAALLPKPRTAAELAQIEALVRQAVGADSARGDQVSVVNAMFESAIVPDTAVKPTMLETIERVQRPAISIIGLALAALVGLLAIRSLRVPPPAPIRAIASAAALPALPLSAQAATVAALPEGPGGAVLVSKSAPRFEVQVGNTVLRDQTIQVVEQSPDDAARLMRVWLREA